MEKSLDEEDDVNDMENAVQFRTLMKEKGYCFFFQDLLRETPLVALLSSQNNYPEYLNTCKQICTFPTPYFADLQASVSHQNLPKLRARSPQL